LLNSPWPRWRLANNCYGNVRERKEAPRDERARKWKTKAGELSRNARPPGSFIKESATRTREFGLHVTSLDISVGNAPTKPADENKKKNQVRGRVYTLNVEEVDHSKDLIQGTGLIKSKPVNIVFDSGATHSFISVECAKRV
jgi:hypothetical protein